MNPAPTAATLRRRQICSLATSLGLLLIAAAVLLAIGFFSASNISGGFPTSPIYKWIFSAGAAVCLAASLFNPNIAADLRTRRWQRIESWSSIFFCAAAAFLWIPGQTPRDWLAFTLAGAVLRIICFFRNIRRAKKQA